MQLTRLSTVLSDYSGLYIIESEKSGAGGGGGDEKKDIEIQTLSLCRQSYPSNPRADWTLSVQRLYGDAVDKRLPGLFDHRYIADVPLRASKGYPPIITANLRISLLIFVLHFFFVFFV